LWRLRRVDVLHEGDDAGGKEDEKKGGKYVFAHALLATSVEAEQKLALTT
jgi:hypothetical protein